MRWIIRSRDFSIVDTHEPQARRRVSRSEVPDDYEPSKESEATIRDISSLNKEMIAAGVRTFVGGLESARKAKTLRAQPDGQVRITDGPFAEAKEHVGGFWVLETADQDEALAWGRKAAKACRAPVEVRAIFQKPAAAKS